LPGNVIAQIPAITAAQRRGVSSHGIGAAEIELIAIEQDIVAMLKIKVQIEVPVRIAEQVNQSAVDTEHFELQARLARGIIGAREIIVVPGPERVQPLAETVAQAELAPGLIPVMM
jgi:hypothetical protein